MKKYYYILATLCVIILTACSKDNNGGGSIDPVSNVTAVPFIGSVTLNFKAPTADNYYYTLITYKDSQGNVKNEKVSRYDVDATTGLTSVVVGGFTDTDSHDFTLTACTYDGGSSSPMSVAATPEATSTAKDYVMGTIDVVPAADAFLVSWTNISGVGVNILVSYKDKDGKSQSLTIDAQKTGSRSIDITGKTDITVYAQNVSDQAKSTSKTWTITPLVNPDDVIKPGVEYITLNSGGMNGMTLEGSNVDNPYQYTIVTTTGDPYCYAAALKAAKAGTTLKFRYKASAAFTLELFWCNAGGGAAGGRSTTVDVPAASSWTTFTHDYSAAMIQHSWAGNAGDFFRTDWGGNSGVTINVRNIHFE